MVGLADGVGAAEGCAATLGAAPGFTAFADPGLLGAIAEAEGAGVALGSEGTGTATAATAEGSALGGTGATDGAAEATPEGEPAESAAT